LAFETTARGDDRIVTDASGRAVAIADTSRIVSIGGSITEILYALGLQQKIVAVDTTSLFPPSALQEKPNVGYMRQLSAEGVLALAPTLVLALQGSGPKETIDVLETSKIPFVAVPDKFSGAGIVEKIRVVAQSAAAPERGECLVRRVGDELATLDGMRAQIRRRLKVAFVLSLAGDRPMIAGRATAADGIIGLAGATNAFADFDGYKLVNDEAISVTRGRAGDAARRRRCRRDRVAQPAQLSARRRTFAIDGRPLSLLGFEAAHGARRATAASLSGHRRSRPNKTDLCAATNDGSYSAGWSGSTECPACAPRFSHWSCSRLWRCARCAAAMPPRSGPAKISLERIAAALFAGRPAVDAKPDHPSR
jgi:iron complex transport system substrate-binding protein